MKHEILPLGNLPPNAKVKWHHLYKDASYHIADEDISWILLGEHLCVDAGQYGRSQFFRVDVVNSKYRWEPFESSICLTTQEVADEIVRLCWKYSRVEYAQIAEEFAGNSDAWNEGWDDGFEADEMSIITPYSSGQEKLDYETGFKAGYDAKNRE